MLHVRGSLIVLLGLIYTCHAGGKISMAFIIKNSSNFSHIMLHFSIKCIHFQFNTSVKHL